MSLNRVVLVGRLVEDPILRFTPNGVGVCNFRLAVNRPFKNQNGENEADFLNITVWRKAAENAAQYLKKGSQAGVDGRLQSRSYENDEGRRIFVVEVIADSVQFLEPKGANQGQENSGYQQPSQNGQQPPQGQGYQQQHQAQQRQPQPQYQGGQPQGNQDPFANGGTPIDIDDSDLPF